jgi:uncharacterized protein (TIGR03435 family)
VSSFPNPYIPYTQFARVILICDTLSHMKASVLLPVFLFVASLAAIGQQSPSALSFEVASIKLAGPQPMGRIRVGTNADRGMIRYTNVSLLDCIRIAYDVKEFQISGPDWLGSQRFDIQAKYPAGATEEEVPEMLQSLLANRFKLQVHRDTREHAVYALVVGKSGPRLKRAEIEIRDEPASDAKPNPGENPPPNTQGRDSEKGGMTSGGPGSGGPPRGAIMMMVDPAGMHLKAPAATLGTISDTLSRFTDRPVVDQTGIQGRYDFDLVFTPQNMRGLGGGPGGPRLMPMGGGPDGAETKSEPGPSIFDAVEQYGLKLEPRKTSLTQIVVDHIEKMPTEN